jgi:hypothetical protein
MNTTRKEREEVINRLARLGIDYHDAQALRRIAMTLHRWHEQECGTDHGCIERDEQTGKSYWLNSTTMHRFPVRDMERGALKRLTALLEKYPTLTPYVQTDPRGASLYLLSQDTLARYNMPIEQIYNHGTAIY